MNIKICFAPHFRLDWSNLHYVEKMTTQNLAKSRKKNKKKNLNHQRSSFKIDETNKRIFQNRLHFNMKYFSIKLSQKYRNSED